MAQKKSQKEEPIITSVSEYVSAVLDKTKTNNPEEKFWFRGHGSTSYDLWPTLYRRTLYKSEKKRPKINKPILIKRIERNMDMPFSMRSFSYFSKKGVPDTPWYRLFLKQHYKLQTRLLDWSESALVALFFALQDPKAKMDNAQVYILKPLKLNNYSINTLLKVNQPFHVVPSCSVLPEHGDLWSERNFLDMEQFMRKYYWLDCKEEEEMFPIAIYPPHLDERMSAQQACFTIFGNMFDGLVKHNCSDTFLDHVTIDAKSKANMLIDLKKLGISYHSVFPDLDGLGLSINDEYNEIFENAKLDDNLSDFFPEVE